MLLLLATYGLRAREVVALTLDDIDWKRERLAIPERKAGHSTAFPLSGAVGEALADYLRNGRPPDRRPPGLLPGSGAVAPGRRRGGLGVRPPLPAARPGIDVPRPGSHTLRHTAVQRLVDAGFALKTIGDFVGHRSPRSTEIYAEGGHRAAAGGRPGRRRGGAGMTGQPRGRRDRVPRAQAGDRTQVPQRGSRAAAAGPLRRASTALTASSDLTPALVEDFLGLPAPGPPPQLQPPARRRKRPAAVGHHQRADRRPRR